MYKDSSQLRIEDFVFPYGKLEPENDWVRLAALVPWDVAKEKDDSDDGNDPPNSGTLVLDATCCPADIAYPQDINLLNQAWEKAEKTVDELCEMTGQKKPRMYRKRTRKDYLLLSKSKKRSRSAIRSAVRRQLQYIRRGIGCIAELVQKGAKLSVKQAERMNVVTTVYEQQRIMFESGTHSISGVSSVWHNPGFGPSSEGKPMPALSLAQNCTSVCGRFFAGISE